MSGYSQWKLNNSYDSYNSKCNEFLIFKNISKYVAVPWEADFSRLLNNVLEESAACFFIIPVSTCNTFFLCVITLLQIYTCNHGLRHEKSKSYTSELIGETNKLWPYVSSQMQLHRILSRIYLEITDGAEKVSHFYCVQIILFLVTAVSAFHYFDFPLQSTLHQNLAWRYFTQ
jgi:hypothetical protein